jgi:acyl-coenzyme A thioesterase 13
VSEISFENNLYVYQILIYSFLKAAKKGETLVIDAETVKLGRTLAFLSVEFRNKQNNELLATGKHTKYVS